VPIYLLDKDKKTVADGKLADIAPTVLDLLGVSVPKDMDGQSLV
jgi:2,3-bisphosphoglycerate-independent phosphoglycerate mutase